MRLTTSYEENTVMYIGSKNREGWKACIREIFQNAIDEMIRKESPCHYVKLTFDERDQSAVIEDTGRGIPHGQIITIYASQHTSSNYTKKPYEYTSGVHGVGSGVAMALSKEFDIYSYVLGKAKHVHFDAGTPWKKGEENISCPAGRQGTTVTMRPDLDVLEDIDLKCEDILDLVLKIFPLINIGDQIDFVGIDSNGKIRKIVAPAGTYDDTNGADAAKYNAEFYYNENAADGRICSERTDVMLELNLQFFAAEGPGGEKTEEPTAKKKQDTRMLIHLWFHLE